MEGLTSFAVLVALTTGLVEVVKRTAGLPTRFVPLTALVAGLVLTGVGGVLDFTPLTLLTGVAVGLSSVGLFAQTKVLNK